MNGYIARVVVVSVLVLSAAVCRAEIVDLSTPGETIEDALKEAQQAVANSSMKLSISAVGFDLSPGSEAEKYLQDMASIGGGSYFAAADGGQLTQALTGAATGQFSAYGDVPIITSPQNGAQVGPATRVEGRASPDALVVIQTEVYDQTTGKFVKMVPGIRHRPEADGTFSLLVSTPKVSFGTKNPMRYEIHVFTARADGFESQHAIVTVDQAP